MKYYSQLGQDKNVIHFYNYDEAKKGFFVEIGAWDGIALSNTYALEKIGWKGICVEPLPDRYAELVKNRSCKTYNNAVDAIGGRSLEFVVAGMLSGDINRIDVDRINREGVAEKKISVTTINFTEMLDDAMAPSFIEFLSLDTEGSEFDILAGLDHAKYKFGYISVEHNYKEPIRSKIRDLLTSKGYTYKGENQWDDDYVYL